MQVKTKKRIGILRGGAGEHYTSSLEKGGEIISHIFENLADKYKPIDILIDKNGIWHLGGLPISPVDLIHKVDMVWNTGHPSFSNILDNLSIPNIGNNSFYFFLENNKDFLREHLKQIGVSVPKIVFSPKNAKEVHEKFPAPWIVKINNEIKIAKTFNELTEAIQNESDVAIEEFVPGKIVSVHSVTKFRGQDVYIFPLGNTFGSFSVGEKEKLTKLIKNLHKHIDTKHYLKSNFVLTPRGRIYLLEIESMPDLKPNSHFFQACESVGAKTYHVIEHILEQAL